MHAASSQSNPQNDRRLATNTSLVQPAIQTAVDGGRNPGDPVAMPQSNNTALATLLPPTQRTVENTKKGQLSSAVALSFCRILQL